MDATRSVIGHGSPPDGRRCRARSKRSGERCRRLAIPGGTGASPPSIVAANARLVATRTHLRFDATLH